MINSQIIFVSYHSFPPFLDLKRFRFSHNDVFSLFSIKMQSLVLLWYLLNAKFKFYKKKTLKRYKAKQITFVLLPIKRLKTLNGSIYRDECYKRRREFWSPHGKFGVIHEKCNESGLDKKGFICISHYEFDKLLESTLKESLLTRNWNCFLTKGLTFYRWKWGKVFRKSAPYKYKTVFDTRIVHQNLIITPFWAYRWKNKAGSFVQKLVIL